MAKIYISIVSYNNLDFLPDCLDSIFKQTYQDFEVVLLDNNSTDGTVSFIKNNYPSIKIIVSKKNAGFAAGHNQVINLAIKNKARYILATNPDIILEKDYLEKIAAFMDKKERSAAVGGKLLKIFSASRKSSRENGQAIIDSTGFKVFKSGRVVERGAGEKDFGQYQRSEEVFGVSAALALYRLSALADVKIEEEYFDEDFFLYKEDIDLSWRLCLRGWQCWYLPWAVAYHYRGAYGEEKQTLRQIFRGRRSKSYFIKFQSYKNHFFLFLKNKFLSNFIIHAPFIIFYELKKFFYILFFEPKIFKVFGEVIKEFPKMARKRKIILGRATSDPKDIRKWFN